MKRVNNLYRSICDLDNIIEMTNIVCKNTKNKKKVEKFETYKMEHIINIKNKLESKDFQFDKYNIFMISDPINNIDIVKEKLENLKINYIIVKDKTIDDIYEHECNSFKEYTSSVFDIISINNKIDKLCNKLKNIHDISIINDILTMIDKVIENYP